MSLAKRVAGLHLRKSLALGDAAYLVQERQGGMWGDAVALLIETITTGELFSAIVYRVLPRHMAQDKVVDEVHTTVARADLEEWLDRIVPVAPATDGKQVRGVAIRVATILKIAKELGYEPLAIPYRGKKTIELECLENYCAEPNRFTVSTFESAWKAASKQKQIEVQNKESYLRR